jgi:hypothetical protein
MTPGKKHILLCTLMFLLTIRPGHAGPPFDTDDPETVKYKHWEYYISSINTRQIGIWSGTIPHLEINYGLAQNLQFHILLPMNYDYSRSGGGRIGYGDTEVGIKYRFIKESESSPQVGIFPTIEIPTVNNKEFTNGKAKIYLPIWLQKSWSKLTTYGGAGYWINPGTGNKNWIFAGWEIQYDFSELVTLGGELYYHSASSEAGKPGAGFNVGGYINFSQKFHILFSIGHTLTGDNVVNSYFGFLWTI